MHWTWAPAKKSASGEPDPSAAKKSELGNADVLRLIHHDVVKRAGSAAARRGMPREAAEHSGACCQPLGGWAGYDALEHRPKLSAAAFGQAPLPPQPPHIAVLFPAPDLPRINHALLFVLDEPQVVGCAVRRARGVGDKLSDALKRLE